MTRSRSEAGITGRTVEGSSRLGGDAGKLGTDGGELAGELAADSDKGAGVPSLGVNVGKRTGVPSRSSLPNFFITQAAS
jgi:hypothetical protein